MFFSVVFACTRFSGCLSSKSGENISCQSCGSISSSSSSFLIGRPSLKSNLRIYIFRPDQYACRLFIGMMMLTKSNDEISNNVRHAIFALFACLAIVIVCLFVVSSDIIFSFSKMKKKYDHKVWLRVHENGFNFK